MGPRGWPSSGWISTAPRVLAELRKATLLAFRYLRSTSGSTAAGRAGAIAERGHIHDAPRAGPSRPSNLVTFAGHPQRMHPDRAVAELLPNEDVRTIRDGIIVGLSDLRLADWNSSWKFRHRSGKAPQQQALETVTPTRPHR